MMPQQMSAESYSNIKIYETAVMEEQTLYEVETVVIVVNTTEYNNYDDSWTYFFQSST